MTNGSYFRDNVLEALRRQLVGPLVDPNGVYPGSDPRQIQENASFGSKHETRHLFRADNGQEVLRLRPVAVYGVGMLYPNLGISDEGKLESEQNPPEPEDEDDEADIDERNSSPVAANQRDVPAEPLEPGEEVAIPRSPRSSAMGVSFMIAGETRSIQLQLAGGRYELFPVTVAGSSEMWWHRFEINQPPIKFEVPRSRGTTTIKKLLQDGALNLEVGVVFHRTDPNGERVVTCYVQNNSRKDDELARVVLFQARLQIELPSDFLQEYRQERSSDNEEGSSLRLLYRHQPVRAVGHGCAASVTEEDGRALMATESLPVSSVVATSLTINDADDEPIELNMKDLAAWTPSAIYAVERMLQGYKHWISIKESELDQIPREYQDIAKSHLEKCQSFLVDVKEGWQLVQDDPDARQCLQWTSQSMAWQQLAYQCGTRKLDFDETSGKAYVEGIEPISDESKTPKWRGFQLAFLLANLAPIANPLHPQRDAVDVVWMPTGGGKTEAYLAVAAFTISVAAFTILWR